MLKAVKNSTILLRFNTFPPTTVEDEEDEEGKKKKKYVQFIYLAAAKR